MFTGISWATYTIILVLLSAIYYAGIYFFFFRKKISRNKKDTANKRNSFTELNSGLYDNMQPENDAAVQKEGTSGIR